MTSDQKKRLDAVSQALQDLVAQFPNTRVEIAVSLEPEYLSYYLVTLRIPVKE